MGEIIIKVPGDKREVYEFPDIESVIKLLEELKKLSGHSEEIDNILEKLKN